MPDASPLLRERLDALTDVSSLTDTELWRLMHGDPPDHTAEEEFFRRCLNKIKRIINAYVFKDRLCPIGQDPHAFADDAFGLAEEKLVCGIKTLQSPERLPGWLTALAKNAAIEEYRKIRRRGKQPVTFEVESHVDTEEGRARAQLPGSFRSRYWQDPTAFVRDREHGDILDLVLSMHAQESKRDADSALWIKTRLDEDLSVEEISERRGTTKDDVWHLFTHDQRKLRDILVQQLKLRVSDL